LFGGQEIDQAQLALLLSPAVIVTAAKAKTVFLIAFIMPNAWLSVQKINSYHFEWVLRSDAVMQYLG